MTCSFFKSSIKSNAYKLLDSREKAKKTKHVGRCEKNKLNFAPCIDAKNLVLGEEFNKTMTNIAKRLELKWKKPHSITKNHVNFRIFLAIMRGVSRYVAGTRTKIEGQSFQSKDGEDIESSLC